MASSSYVALLRGINVGGKNMLPMRELVPLFALSGCTDARSYIQSGNVVFSTTPSRAERLPAAISKHIADRFGLRVPVVVRSSGDLGRIVRANPFLAAGADADRLHVAFLADAPSRTAVGALDPLRSPPDAFEVRGRDIYLFCPNGVGRTKLTNAYFDSKLATISTWRNWRTVLKLLAMSEE